MIISDQCGISEFVRDRVGLVLPRDIASFTAGLQNLLTDKALYDHFRQNCPAVAAELGWTKLLAQQEELYLKARGQVQPEIAAATL